MSPQLWPLAAGAVASTLRFLACVTVVQEPEFWALDVDLPNQFLPKLLDKEKLFAEVEDLVREGRQWPVATHREGIVIRSQRVPSYGRTLFFADATMPATPDQMLDVFWADGRKIVDWNPTADAVEVVKDFDDSTRITWQSTKAQLGGLISKRDFVNLNFWRKIPLKQSNSVSSSGQASERDERYAIEIAYTNTTWPSKPPSHDFVRGLNGPSIMVFHPMPGREPHQVYTKMSWVFNAHMDFSSFVPIGVVDRLIPSTLVEYIKNLRNHVSRKHQS